MPNLESLICSEIDDTAQVFYVWLRAISEDENNFVNTTFELEIKPEEEFEINLKKIFERI